MQTRVTENDLYRSQLQQILKIDRAKAWAYEEFIRFGFPCSQQHLFKGAGLRDNNGRSVESE